MSIEEMIHKGEIVLIERKQLDRLLRETRLGIVKKICSAKEAMYILGMSAKTFYKHIKTVDCLVKLANKVGTYDLESVYNEARRLTSNKIIYKRKKATRKSGL